MSAKLTWLSVGLLREWESASALDRNWIIEVLQCCVSGVGRCRSVLIPELDSGKSKSVSAFRSAEAQGQSIEDEGEATLQLPATGSVPSIPICGRVQAAGEGLSQVCGHSSFFFVQINSWFI